MKIGGFLVLRVKKPYISTINGEMVFKVAGMSHLNNGRGLFAGDRFRGRGRLRGTTPKGRLMHVQIPLAG